jgi:hypothetical protein
MYAKRRCGISLLWKCRFEPVNVSGGFLAEVIGNSGKWAEPGAEATGCNQAASVSKLVEVLDERSLRKI